MKPYSLMTESELQEAVAEYLVLQYPDVMFHSDFGSSVKMSVHQGARKKRQNGGRRGWPDMFIAQSMPWCLNGLGSRLLNDEAGSYLELSCEVGSTPTQGTISYYGLFLELKKDGTRLKKKNGDWATEHIAEQAEVLNKLRERGYCAEFAVGFDEAKKIIDEYLGGK